MLEHFFIFIFSCFIDADGVTSFYKLLRSSAGTVYHTGIAHMPPVKACGFFIYGGMEALFGLKATMGL